MESGFVRPTESCCLKAESSSNEVACLKMWKTTFRFELF